MTSDFDVLIAALLETSARAADLMARVAVLGDEFPEIDRELTALGEAVLAGAELLPEADAEASNGDR